MMVYQLTCRINDICLKLDVNPFLSQDNRQKLLRELEDLVDKRNKLELAFKCSSNCCCEDSEKNNK